MHNRLAWSWGIALCVSTFGCSSSGGGDPVNQGGSAGSAGSSAGTDSGGATGAGGDGSGNGGGPTTGGSTSLSGVLGDLGKVQPTVSSLVILNSGERLVYLSSAPITCDTLSVSRWLGSTPADAQVVEIVVKSSFTTGTIAVGKAEVNYAKGGRSSSYEVSASSGSVTFTINEAMGVAEGTVDASYDSPVGSVKGAFHAEYCDGGQGY
jgi:hypothetical protein